MYVFICLFKIMPTNLDKYILLSEHQFKKKIISVFKFDFNGFVISDENLSMDNIYLEQQ